MLMADVGMAVNLIGYTLESLANLKIINVIHP